MNSTPGRQALYHFLASAVIGLTVTALSAVLPDLIARQQTLAPQTAGYAALSLLISAGMAAYGYVTAHQAQLVDKVSQVLNQVNPDQVVNPHPNPLPEGEGTKAGSPLPTADGTSSEAQP